MKKVKNRFLDPIRFEEFPWAIYSAQKYKDDKPGGLLQCGICVKAKKLNFMDFSSFIYDLFIVNFCLIHELISANSLFFTHLHYLLLYVLQTFFF